MGLGGSRVQANVAIKARRCKVVRCLRSRVKGFWVEMPLDWGYAQGKTPPPPITLQKSIAKAEQEGDVVEEA